MRDGGAFEPDDAWVGWRTGRVGAFESPAAFGEPRQSDLHAKLKSASDDSALAAVKAVHFLKAGAGPFGLLSRIENVTDKVMFYW